MTDFKVLRYFLPGPSDTFTAGWYLTDNDDGLTRVGDMIPADNSEVYGVANQIIIDDNTPDDSTAGGVSPLSGGAGLDQFLITNTANSVTIDDDSGDNMIVFALDVEIKSITSDASGASPVYVITLSTDKVITVRNPSSFTFQHLGDTTRTAPISAAEFLTAYPFEAVIELSNLVYNVGGEVIVISQDNLLTSHGSQDDLSMLVYIIRGLPTNGTLWKGDTQLDDQSGSNSFTQEDVNNGLITYRPSDSSPAQSDSFSFVVVNSGVIPDIPKQVPGVFQITPREDVDVQNSEGDNTIDLSGETAPRKIDTGDGSDTITGGEGDDQIDAGTGDDEITLTLDDDEGNPVDAGADEVLYTFGYGGDGIDGGDAIKGFRRGQDKLKFVVNSDSSDISTLTAFLQSLSGEDGEYLTDDDAFTVTMMWGFDEDGVFYFDGVLLHFKEASAFSNGPLSSPVVSITFDERLGFDDLVEILGGAGNVADNFDGGLTAFKNLDEVLPRLFGENSIDFEVRPIDEVSVVDGPVAGAKVFFDLNSDGEITDAEKDAQRDESGRSRYITGEDGTTQIPEQYVGRAFVADVDGAYDIATGERLEGEFRSLDEGRGGIATPITDLIVTYLEEVEGQAGTPTTEQEVLDEIFGDGEITLADILDAGNYEIPADTDTPENNKKDLISKISIALTEIKENDDLADGDDDGSTTKVEIVSAIKTLVDSPGDSSVEDLEAAVDARVTEVNAVRNGKPIAIPASVDGVEDTDYAFPDTPEALTGLFGFRDPSGNDPAADTSSFRGVYIRIDIENASLRLDDNTQVVADTDLSGSDTVDAIVGYVYVTFDNLDGLKITPAPNFNGDLALVYRVWDGEEVSSDAELIINIAGVNDAPVAGTDIASQSGTVGEKITDIDLSGLFTDIDGDEVTLTFTVTLAGSTVANADTGLSIRNDMLTGTLSGSLAAGDYTITVTATDPSGEMDTSEFTFTVLEKTIEATAGGNAATIVENDLVTYFATGTLTSSVSGTITLDGADGSGNLEATYGTMTFDGSVWRYELDNEDDDTQMLRDGDTEEEAFTFRDGTTSFTVTITINGANDVPVVESGNEIVEQAGQVGQEITAIDLSGLFTDVDAGDTFTLAVVLDDGSALSTIGLSYDPVANEITGTIRSDVSAGTYTIEVIATDGSGAASQPSTFDIVVAAFNNPPVIGGEVDGMIAEDAVDSTGTLTITDAEGDALPMVVLTDGAGQYGTLTFVASADGGVWTYRLNNANPDVQALKGDTLEDNFTFTAEGADPITVTITISGVNDAPVVESGNEIGGQTGQVGQAITAIDLSGLFTDVDTGDTFTLTVMVLSSDGSKSGLDTIGLEYDSDTKMITGTLLNSIVAGTYTIEVIATDGSGAASQPSTFTIVVVADGAPVIGGAVDSTIAEDAADPIMGTLTITDAEGDALPMVVLTDGAGQYGTLTFVASADGGVWTYTLDNANPAVQALKGDTLEDNFTFTAEGAAPITVTITITGVNDVPVVESGNEIGGQTGRVGQEIDAIDLSSLFTDVDTGDTLTLTVVLGGGFGASSPLATLGLEYDSDTKMITGTLLDSVVADTYTILVIATDGSGAESQPSTFDIVVAPDNAPVIGGEVDGTIAEDAANPLTGTLTITDADVGDALPMVVLTDGAGRYGTLTFVASGDGGVWTYRLDNANAAVQALKDNTLTDEFTFTAEGADDITVTITISGVNDAPVVESEIVEQAGQVGQEITAIDLSGLFTDVDAGDTFTLAVMVHDGSARVGLDTLGLTYDPVENEITGTIGSDVSAGTYTIEVIATDGGGSGAASQPSTFEIVISASSNNPTVFMVDTNVGTVVEDVEGQQSAMGMFTVEDPDTPGNPPIINIMGDDDSDGVVEGLYGTMVLDRDTNTWTYTLDPMRSQALQEPGPTGSQEPDEEEENVPPPERDFTFTAGDADPIVVTIEATGSNDVPEIIDGSEIVTQEWDADEEITPINVRNFFHDPDDPELIITLDVRGTNEPPPHANNRKKVTMSEHGLTFNKNTFMLTGNPKASLDKQSVLVRANDVRSPSSIRVVELRWTVNTPNRAPEVVNPLQDLTWKLEENIRRGDGISVSDIFSDPDGDDLRITVDFFDEGGGMANPGQSGLNFNQQEIIANNGIKGAIGTVYTVRITASDGSLETTHSFTITVAAAGGASGASDETDSGAVLGNGIEGAVIGDETDTLGQILIGGDNAQTLNAGEGGDMIIGGRGDDTINLGAGADTVLYRYDGAEDTAPTAHDGGDVINDFDVDEDTLILAEAENESIYTDTAEFYDAIKGVSLIVDGDGNITGVVFTFAGQDGPDQDAATQEIDLTVNFEEDDFVAPSDIDLTAFEDAEDGERAITDGEETAAYEVIDAILGSSVELANFDDLGIELNPAETDII